jgi:hypothetical protein
VELSTNSFHEYPTEAVAQEDNRSFGAILMRLDRRDKAGNQIHTSRYESRRTSKFVACWTNPALEDVKATFELYPNNMMRAFGIWVGRNPSSCSHILPSADVQVEIALEVFLKGFSP